MTSSDLWSAEQAERYDDPDDEMFSPEVLGRTVDLLAELAGGGAAVEFAIGTGRVAVPLRQRGIPVAGNELSAPMAAKVHEKIDASDLPVVIGDMATTRVPGDFTLAFLVYNTLGNLRTQAEQVQCFRNAADHLVAGGRFVIEMWIPPLRRFPPGQAGVPFEISAKHLGLDTYDLVTQQGTSHHYYPDGAGGARYAQSNFRYVWPAETDLMAQLAGMELENRYAGFDRSEFTSESASQVSIYRKP